MIRHASNPLDRESSLCGCALRIGDMGAATPGQVINCPQCRAVIVWAKSIKCFHAPTEDVTAAVREAFEG